MAGRTQPGACVLEGTRHAPLLPRQDLGYVEVIRVEHPDLMAQDQTDVVVSGISP